MQRFRRFLLGLIFIGSFTLRPAAAQTNSFKQTNLISDTAGMAAKMDQKLVNPWGIAFLPNQPFWIANNGSGFTTLNDQNGGSQGSFVVGGPNGSSAPASPTGIVANVALSGFVLNNLPSLFIFDGEDGTISAWNPSVLKSVAMVDNSTNPTAATGAVYKGLALIQNATGSFLLATNFRSGKVEIYDTNFKPTQILGPGAFNDPALPAVPANSGSPGYAPFGIHVITVNNAPMVVVTYVLQDMPMHDPLPIAGAGFVDLFSTNGAMVRRITSDSHLNAPWGVVMPPTSFGSFGASGDLLVGNFGDGTINAFNFATGAFVDQVKNHQGTPITNASLWDMVFGGGMLSGDPKTLYITAGLANEMHGLFAAITPDTTPTPDFSISASPAMMTVSAGHSAMFTVTLGGLNGFNSAVTLSCSGLPINSTCTFTPMSVTPASGGMMTSAMNITTNSLPYHAGGVMAGTNTRTPTYAAFLLIPALGLFALLLAGASRYRRLAGKKWVPRLAYSFGLFIAVACLLAAGGCGYNASNAGNGTQRGTATVMITGTSNTAGNLSHSTSVSLTVQ